MARKIAFILFSCLLLFIGAQMADARVSGTELMTAYSIRISILNDGDEYEWEYDSPNHYEYEEGNYVIKGKKAKKEVDSIVQLLHLHPKAKMEEMVEALQKRYKQLEKVDIRFMSEESKLFTWTWNSQLEKELK
ncbi:hypothetical protein [Alkalihalobacillus sp. 1P02AB]|uniref:hypothetical protein n=1 Tax=Alkalihalobacillus sp. 1P02AB TaxID=3132260 RepID=UPI0039A67285